MIEPFLQIAWNTCRETLRQPIYFLVSLSALVLIGVYPLFTLFVFREQVKLVVDSAMATMMLFGWILAVLSATHSISREIHNGTVLLVLSKPVNRNMFIAAKICGILAALSLFAGLASIASLTAVRVAKDQFNLDNTALAIYFSALGLSCLAGGVANFMRRVSFPMTAVLAMCVLLPLSLVPIYNLPIEEGTMRLHWPLVPALILVGYSILAMGTLATALSTRLDMVPNLIVCGVVFVVGLVSDHFLGRFAAGNWAIFVIYNVIPNWQLFWMADALAAKKSIPWSYVAWAGVYIVFFVALFFTMAALFFRNREVGQQDLV